MKIQEIQIKGLFGKKDIRWKLNPQVNVLVGVNGSGKSTILSTIYCMLNDIPNSSNSMIFNIAEIHLLGKEQEQIIGQNNQSTEIDVMAENIVSQIVKTIEAIQIKTNKNNRNQKKPDDLLKLKEKLFDDIKTKLTDDARYTEEIKKIQESKKHSNQLNITMISTLNLSANAVFEFKGSNKEVLNILDLEMDKVLNQFNQKNNNTIKTKLIDSLNFFLNTVNKEAEYNQHAIIYHDKDIQKKLKFSDLSSGEKQLVYILVQVALNATEKEKSSIILMDEPEISLHLDWQEHFIKQLTILNPDAQFIIVTHSPALIMNGWNDVYVDMEEITTWL